MWRKENKMKKAAIGFLICILVFLPLFYIAHSTLPAGPGAKPVFQYDANRPFSCLDLSKCSEMQKMLCNEKLFENIDKVLVSTDGNFIYFTCFGKLYRATNNWKTIEQIFDMASLKDYGPGANVMLAYFNANSSDVIVGKGGDIAVYYGKAIAASSDYGNSWKVHTFNFYITTAQFADNVSALNSGDIVVCGIKGYFTKDPKHTEILLYNSAADIEKELVFGGEIRNEQLNPPSVMAIDNYGNVYLSFCDFTGYMVRFNILKVLQTNSYDSYGKEVCLVGDKITSLAIANKYLYIGTNSSGLYRINLKNALDKEKECVKNPALDAGESAVVPEKVRGFYIFSGYRAFHVPRYVRISDNFGVAKIVPAGDKLFVNTKRMGVFVSETSPGKTDAFYKVIQKGAMDGTDNYTFLTHYNGLRYFTQNGVYPYRWLCPNCFDFFKDVNTLWLSVNDFAVMNNGKTIIMAVIKNGIIIFTVPEK